MPGVSWQSHAVQSERYESTDNLMNTARSDGLKLTGWDRLVLSLGGSMSTVDSTVAAWVRTESGSADWAEWWGAEAYDMRLELRPSGCPQLWSDGAGSRGRASSDRIAAVRDGHWHHLAVVYGESAVQLLVDGVAQLSAAGFSPASYSSLRVGGSDEAHSVGVRATFSDLQLWRSELGQIR